MADDSSLGATWMEQMQTPPTPAERLAAERREQLARQIANAAHAAKAMAPVWEQIQANLRKSHHAWKERRP